MTQQLLNFNGNALQKSGNCVNGLFYSPPYVVEKKTDVGFNARAADEQAVVLWT